MAVQPLLTDALVGEAFRALLVFARLGSALLLVPGFGEQYVLPRQRLLFGLLLSLLAAPVAAAHFPPPPLEPAGLASLVGGEVFVGLFIGAVTRFAVVTMHVAGTIVSMQSGLSTASFYDPNLATQGTLPGNLFTTTALVVMFASDLHHLVLRALVGSYGLLPLAGGLSSGDALTMMLQLASGAVSSGLQLAAPLVLTGLLANLAIGIMGRLVPALQLLTVAMPLQLLLAMALLMLGVGAAAASFGRFLVTGLSFLDVAGG